MGQRGYGLIETSANFQTRPKNIKKVKILNFHPVTLLFDHTHTVSKNEYHTPSKLKWGHFEREKSILKMLLKSISFKNCSLYYILRCKLISMNLRWYSDDLFIQEASFPLSEVL